MGQNVFRANWRVPFRTHSRGKSLYLNCCVYYIYTIKKKKKKKQSKKEEGKEGEGKEKLCSHSL